jgi:predicted nucleic acid-binding protein
VIVVDTNVLAYFWIPGDSTPAARRLATVDPDWKAPLLWKSEFRNVLSTLIRTGKLAEDLALEVVRAAESQMSESEFPADSEAVLRLAASSGASAYGCEFVALAMELGVPLVTSDRKLAKAFPGVTRLLDEAADGVA